MTTSAYRGALAPDHPAVAASIAATKRRGDFLSRYAERAEPLITAPYSGITADGIVEPGLFSLHRTGVSTAPIREAAEAYLASLNARLQRQTRFPIDTDQWRRWSNIHPTVMRHGVALVEMTAEQRDRALGLLQAGLSATGYQTARDVMRLNETVREMTAPDRDDEYGEWLYWLSIMGEPSDAEPWGWQIDGHHLIVNCFVLGDQVVMTPMFMGSEPVYAESGRYAGTRVFAAEERLGLELAQSLSRGQRDRAIIGEELPGDVLGSAFADNLVLPYQGIRYPDLSPVQRDRLAALMQAYIGRTRREHAEVKMKEIEQHLPATRFAWAGGFEEDSVFYYRIHSPVVMLEFDHQRGVAFPVPTSRNHVHTAVRTPNGNDYGKDLLRQHLARHHGAG